MCLFNYYKGPLNSLIAFALFLAVSITDFFFKLKASKDNQEKKNYKILLSLSIIIGIIVSVVIVRKFGYHISFSRSLMKITLLISVIGILPYLLYSGLIKNKLFITLFLILILSFLNSIQPRYLFSTDFSSMSWFVYKNPVEKVTSIGIDTVKTLASFHEIGNNFYEMTYMRLYSNFRKQ